MSLNVPPAQGVTPATAAKELRELLRELYRREGQTEQPKGDSVRKKYHEAFEVYFNDINTAVLPGGRLYKDIQELLEISKKRRPSETRAKVNEMLLSGSMHYVRSRLAHLNKMEERIYGVGGAPPKPANPSLKRAYELVQVLPTMENAPSGKEQTTLRAITAIVKAYYGIVEGGPEQLPSAIGHLLTGMLEEGKLEATVAEMWIPLKVPGGSVVAVADELEAEMPPEHPKGPYKIVQYNAYGKISYVFEKKNWLGTAGEISFGSPEDGEPWATISWEDWDDGNTHWDTAKAHFIHMCNKFKTKNICLVDVDGTVVAQRKIPHEPIVWVGEVQELPLIQFVPAPSVGSGSEITFTTTTTTNTF